MGGCWGVNGPKKNMQGVVTNENHSWPRKEDKSIDGGPTGGQQEDQVCGFHPFSPQTF